MTLPIVVQRGQTGGPRLFLSACIHGDEMNGVEIIDRVLRHPALGQLAGTLIAAPVVNVYGFVSGSRYFPDRRDLNRCFPGSQNGPLADQVAHVFMREVVTHAHAGIDLHTGAVHRQNAPQIRANLDDEACLALARAFDAPFVLHAEHRDGSLRQCARKIGVPVVVYEGGEALRFDEDAIQEGVAGVLRVMVHLGMLQPDAAQKQARLSLEARKSRWVRAPIAGVLRRPIPLGARVQPGDVLATVSDPLGEDAVPLIAPKASVVIGRHVMPAVHRGDALFHLALQEDDETDDQADDMASEPALWSGSRT